MATLSVQVFGGVEIMQTIFNAIASLRTSETFVSLTGIAILVGAIMALIQYMRTRSLLHLAYWIVQYVLVYSLLFVPTCTVQLNDKVTNTARGIDNVPLSMGFLAHLTSNVGWGLTSIFEMVFSLPDDVKYSQTGHIMGAQLLAAKHQFQITDQDFLTRATDFMEHCVFYDLIMHRYTMGDLLQAPDMWSFVVQNTSQSRLIYPKLPIETHSDEKNTLPKPFSESADESELSVPSCRTYASQLNTKFGEVINQTATHFSAKIFGKKPKAKEQLLALLPLAYADLDEASKEGEAVLKQHVMANLLNQSAWKFAGAHGEAALSAYGYEKAQWQKRLANENLGMMATYWLPLTRIVIQAILYAAFPILLVLLFLPNGISYLRIYTLGLLWLELWSLPFAVLNLVLTTYAHVQARTLIGAGSVSVDVITNLDQQFLDLANVASYLSMSVPLIAYWLTNKFNAYALTQLTQYIGGMTQSAASGAAAEMSSGNLSLGNTSFGNQQRFNHSAFHSDTNSRFLAGSHTAQLSGGETLTTTADGHQVIDGRGAQSYLGTNINMADSLSKSFSQSATDSVNRARVDLQTASESYSSALSSVYSLGDHINHGHNSGENFTSSETARINEAASNVYSMVARVAKSHGLDSSEVMRALGSYNWNLGGQGSGKPGFLSAIPGLNKLSALGGANYSHSNSKEDSLHDRIALSAAKELMSNEQFTQSLETSMQGVRSSHYQTQDAESKSLVDNIGENYQKAMSAREDASEQLQQAKNYQEASSYVSNNSASIQSNMNTAFVTWLSKQPPQGLMNGEMGLDNASHIVNRQPELANSYAQQFVDERKAGILAEMRAQHDMTSGALKQDYAKATSGSLEGRVQTAHQAHKGEVASRVPGDWDNNKPVSDAAKHQVQQQLANSREAIERKKGALEGEGSDLSDEVKGRIDKGLGKGIKNSRFFFSTLQQEERKASQDETTS